jgi:steroid delta-isomerase-like uncharacterized protein
MDVLNTAQCYFDAWNRRDADGIVATFAAGGTYNDPASGGPISGQALAGYVKSLWSSFPDLAFEIVSAGTIGDGLVAAQWIMRGTHLGPFQELPPTGKRIELPGADFIRVVDGAIDTVQGYFETRALVEQLGLQVIVQPRAIGPFTFGTTSSVQTGKRARPGAFSITTIYPQSNEQVEYVRNTSRQIALEMLEMPGFIGWSGLSFGETMKTVTAWETPEHVRLFARNGTHRRAMQDYYSTLGAAGGMTSVWVPERINTTIRCIGCGRMMDYDRAQGQCACGAALPEPMPYW